MSTKQPTPEQTARLIEFATANGRNWKSELLSMWLNGRDANQRDGHLLRQVRNTLGPRWLSTWQLPAAPASCAEAYFIIDDALGESGAEGFEVMHGDPWAAVGVSQFQAKRLGDCKRWLASRVAEGETVYRVRLARRHGEHSVRPLPMP